MAGPSIARAEVTVDLNGERIPAEAKALGEESGALMGDEHAKAFDDKASKGIDEFGTKAEKDLGDHGKKSGEAFGSELEKGLSPSLEKARRDLSVPFQQAGGEVHTLGSDMRGLSSEFDSLGNHVDAADSSTGKFRGGIAELETLLGPTGDKMQELRTHSVQLGDSFDAVGSPTSRLDDYLKRLFGTVDGGGGSFGTAGAEIHKLADEADSGGVKVERSGGRFAGFFGALKGLVGLGPDVGAFGTAVEKAGAEAATGGANAGKGSGGFTSLIGALGGLGGAGGIVAVIGLVIGLLPELATLLVSAAGGLVILGGAFVAALSAAAGLRAAFTGMLGPINQLPPSAQGAATALQGLVGHMETVKNKTTFVVGAIGDLQTALQATTFVNLQKPIQALTDTLIPALTNDMKVLGGALNEVLASWLHDLNSSGFRDNMANLFAAIDPEIENIGKVFSNVFGIIGEILIQTAPTVAAFTSDLANMLGSFLAFLKTPQGHHDIQDFMNNTKKVLGEVGKVIGDVTQALIGLVTPSTVGNTVSTLESLSGAVQNIVKASANLSTITTAIAGAINTVTAAAAAIATVIDPILTVVEVLFASVFGGLRLVGSAISSLINGPMQLLFTTLSTDGTLAADLFGGHIDKIPADLAKATGQMQSIIGKIGTDVSAALGSASSAFDQLDSNSKTQSLAVAHNFGLTGDAAKTFAGELANLAQTGGVDLKKLGSDKSVEALANDLGITKSAALILLTGLKDTSAGGVSAIDKLRSDATANLNGVDAKMSATGDVAKVLAKGFETTAGTSKTAMAGLATANSWSDIQNVLAGTGSAAKTKMANNIIQAAAESGVAISALPPEIQKLIDKYGTIPKNVSTKVTLTGWDQAIANANSVAAALNGLHDKTINVTQITNQVAQGHAAIGGVMAGGRLIAGGMAFAGGGILSTPSWFGNVLAGEAGAEAIVPLSRPLSEVDPSVRNLAAYAQGMGATTNKDKPSTYVASGAIQINTPAQDPAIVAEQTLDRLVARLG